jgi:nitrogen regulatory protein P-II 1
MKKIEAIIREEKLEPIRKSLEGMGLYGMTITEVSGRGRQKGIALQWRVGEYKVDFLPKLKLEMVLADKDAPQVVKMIQEQARTGDIGDGKIFVLPVDNCVRVRTGEEGEEAI